MGCARKTIKYNQRIVGMEGSGHEIKKLIAHDYLPPRVIVKGSNGLITYLT